MGLHERPRHHVPLLIAPEAPQPTILTLGGEGETSNSPLPMGSGGGMRPPMGMGSGGGMRPPMGMMSGGMRPPMGMGSGGGMRPPMGMPGGPARWAQDRQGTRKRSPWTCSISSFNSSGSLPHPPIAKNARNRRRQPVRLTRLGKPRLPRPRHPRPRLRGLPGPASLSGPRAAPAGNPAPATPSPASHSRFDSAKGCGWFGSRRSGPARNSGSAAGKETVNLAGARRRSNTMDQVKLILAMAKRHHFWVLLGVVLLCSLGVWYATAAGLADQTAKRKTELESKLKALEGIKNDANPPNAKVVEQWQDKGKVLDGKVGVAWRKLYEDQRQRNPWPEGFPKDFLSWIEQNPPEKFPDKEIPPLLREEYRDFIMVTQLPKLRVMVRAREPVPEEEEETDKPAGKAAAKAEKSTDGKPTKGEKGSTSSKNSKRRREAREDREWVFQGCRAWAAWAAPAPPVRR